MASLTFETHGARLLRENVRPDHVGGFLTYDRATGMETLFAVFPATGRVLSRSQPIGGREFDGEGWQEVAACPPFAEWCGGYKLEGVKA